MKYLFTLVLILASAGSAFADPHDTTISNIPFDFFIGTTAFPAGTYTISRVSDDASGELLIRSKDGTKAAFFLPIASASSDPNGEVKLRFRHEGDQYYLMEVYGGLDTYTVNSTRSQQKAVSPDKATVSP